MVYSFPFISLAVQNLHINRILQATTSNPIISTKQPTASNPIISTEQPTTNAPPKTCGKNQERNKEDVCICHDGYVRNSTTGECEDKDECINGESKCLDVSSICKNLAGSYECMCRPGYEKVENDTDCVNINECEKPELEICHFCLDTPGSFICRCFDGYVLQEDGKACIKEKDKCGMASFCDGICMIDESEGHYSCKKCPSGLFQLDKEKQKCIPIDECKKEREVCTERETCFNLGDGRPAVCLDLNCPRGYEMSQELKNKCIEKNSVNSTSITKSFFRWDLKDMNITDKIIYNISVENNLDFHKVDLKLKVINLMEGMFAVNETYFKIERELPKYRIVLIKQILIEQNYTIEINATRNGILDKFILQDFVVCPECRQCAEGYSENPITGLCESENHCDFRAITTCEKRYAECRSLIDSYECLCKPGSLWNEDLMICVDVDYCQYHHLHKCSHECVRKEASFSCLCHIGYDMLPDEKTCVDANPCNEQEYCDGVWEKSKSECKCKRCKNGVFVSILNDKTSEECLQVNNCKERNMCPANMTCVDLKDGDSTIVCLNLSCPQDYQLRNEDGVCIKENISDDRALAISKRLIRLPFQYLQEEPTDFVIYRFNLTDCPGRERVEFELENIEQKFMKKYAVKKRSLKILHQKMSYVLLLSYTRIKREQEFRTKVNVFCKGKKVQTYELFVFVV